MIVVMTDVAAITVIVAAAVEETKKQYKM